MNVRFTWKQHIDRIPELHGEHFPSYLPFDFFYILIVLNGMSSYELFQAFVFCEKQ